MRCVLRFLFKMFFSLKIVHGERLVFTGPAIIMPNHVSFLDAILMYLFLPERVCFVVNTSIASNPIVAFGLRFRRHLAVDPLSPYSLRAIMGVVKEGFPVVLFPEGRISTTGSLMKIYAGAAMVAWKTNATIFPVILRGPEFSIVSRMQGKLRTRWFPSIQIYFDNSCGLSVDPSLNFRAQKGVLADKLLIIMQNALFAARREQHGGRDFFVRLTEAAKLYGMERPIVRDITRAVTYRKLIIGIHVMAGKLQSLLPEPEKTTGLLMPNAVAHVVALFALFRLGKTPAILNFSTGTKNVVDCAKNAEVKTVLTSRTFVEKGGFAELVAKLGETCRIIYLEDIGATVGTFDKLRGLWQQWLGADSTSGPESRLILFTSGTEGRPKGVVLSHDAILANIDQVASIIDYTPADRMLNALPMFHSFGLMAGTLLPLLGGVELYLYPSPLHYRIVPELAYDFNATVLLSTPTFLAGYGKMAHPYDFYDMRLVLAGGEKLNATVRQLWLEKFGLRVLEGYGSTETSPVLGLNTPLAYKTGSVGRFMPGVEWRLEPVPGVEKGGALFVKGPNLMDGYLHYDKGFQPVAEWFATGDVVEVDESGFISIQARLKRFAKVAGEMINLQVVEEAATASLPPGTHAVVAAPDSRKGEQLILFTSSKSPDRMALREHLLRTGHSALYVPAKIVTIEKVPLLGTGKRTILLCSDRLRKSRVKPHERHEISARRAVFVRFCRQHDIVYRASHHPARCFSRLVPAGGAGDIFIFLHYIVTLGRSSGRPLSEATHTDRRQHGQRCRRCDASGWNQSGAELRSGRNRRRDIQSCQIRNTALDDQK